MNGLRTRRWPRWALVLALLAGAAPTPLDAAPQGPAVEVRTLDQGVVKGALAGLAADAVLVREPGGASDRRLAPSQLISMDFPDAARTAREGPAGVLEPSDIGLRAHLVGGEILRGIFRGPSEEGVLLEVPGLGTLDLVFDIVLTLERLSQDDGACQDTLIRFRRPESGDRAYDIRGDELDGSVFEATAKSIVIEDDDGRKRNVAWDRLRVLHLENEPLKSSGTLQSEVELAQGSRIQIEGAAGKAAKGLTFAMRSLPKRTWTLPWKDVLTIRWSGGAFVYASDLPFTSTHKPYHKDPEGLLDPAFQDRFFGARKDRRSNGCPLRINGRTYRHGFGVNSHSTIRIPLNGAYRTFLTGFGIDDDALKNPGEGGRRGNVDARIEADGKVLWKVDEVIGGQPVVRVGPLDVTGVKELVLIVGFGKELMTRDRADWVDPILVRK